MASNRSFDPAAIKAAAADYSSSSGDDDEGADDFRMPSTNPHADDDFADYNPRKRRRTGRDAKESAALGIFGSDSEDGGPGQRWKQKSNLRRKGVQFVSTTRVEEDGPPGGARDDQSDQSMGEESDDDEELQPMSMSAFAKDDEPEDDDEDEAPAGLGLGMGAATSFTQNPARMDTSRRSQKLAAPAFTRSAPLGQGFTPSSDQQPVLSARAQAMDSKRASQAGQASSGGKGGASSTFAARMMSKMGFVAGQGLGREGQGRNDIIEPNLRPQGAGLGAVKEKTVSQKQEEKRQAQLRGEVYVDSDEERQKEKAARKRNKALGGARSNAASGASTPRPQKPRYMTMDEVKQAAPGLKIPDAAVSILDMTGPAQRMLTSSSGLMTPTSTGAEASAGVGSKQTALARRSRDHFMAIIQEWKSVQENKAYTQLKLKQHQQELEEMEGTVSKQQSLVEAFGALATSDSDITMEGGDNTKQRWDEVMTRLKSLKVMMEGAVDLVKNEMSSMAVAALHPLLKEMIDAWYPLEASKKQYAADLGSIGELLGIDSSSRKAPLARANATPYESMMYKLWLPHISRTIRAWNVHDPDAMLALIDGWIHILPYFIRTQILNHDIARKLEEAVALWEPKRKSHQEILPHMWLFPWLQYLPAHHLDPSSSTGLVADVKRKFRKLIDAWQFDQGLIPGLKVWRTVLRPSEKSDEWRPLVMNHILPSMARYLIANFRVDPSCQEVYMPVMDVILDWQEVVSPSLVGQVIVAEVFPLWHEMLYQWLLKDDADYEDIADWVDWWLEEALPAEIGGLPSITQEFDRGFAMLEEALQLGRADIARLKPPTKHHAARETRKPNGHHHHHRNHEHSQRHHDHTDHANSKSAPQPNGKAASQQFRHIVEDWCQANDVQFIPERNKTHAEGPLYRLTSRMDGRGGALGFFKGNKLLMQTKSGVREISGGEEGGGDWDMLMTLVM